MKKKYLVYIDPKDIPALYLKELLETDKQNTINSLTSELVVELFRALNRRHPEVDFCVIRHKPSNDQIETVKSRNITIVKVDFLDFDIMSRLKVFLCKILKLKIVAFVKRNGFSLVSVF